MGGGVTSNRIGYFCLAPHSYVTSSDSARRSPSPSWSPPSTPTQEPHGYHKRLNLIREERVQNERSIKYLENQANYKC